jgi:hypothetical protein
MSEQQFQGTKVNQLLYSAFVMQKASGQVLFQPFAHGKFQILDGSALPPSMFEPKKQPGHPGRGMVGKFHTNCPKAGVAGLPRGWKLNVERITVISDRALSAWSEAAACWLTLRHKTAANVPPLNVYSITLGNALAGTSRLGHSLNEMQPFWVEVFENLGGGVHPADCAAADPSVPFAAAVERAKPPTAGSRYDEYRFQDFEQTITDLKAHRPVDGEAMFWVLLEGPGEILIV